MSNRNWQNYLRINILALLALILCFSVSAQQRLTLPEAIKNALAENFDIAISSVGVQQAQRNNTLGNAGFLPNVNAGATTSQTLNNVRSDLANGTQQINPRNKNSNLNPSISASWTIFDGGRMFLVKKQLNELESISKLQLRQQMQTVVSKTIQSYAQVALQQKQLMAVDTALRLAHERMELANLKYKTGASAKVDFLQARVDYNARRADSLKYVATWMQASDSLSVLMGRDEGVVYIVDDSLPVNAHLQPADKDRLRDLNLSLNIFRENAGLSKLNSDIAKTYALPTLTLNGVYSYNRSRATTGFALFNQTYGATGSVNLSVPIFQGGNIRRQAQVASLQAMRDQLLYEKQNTIVGKQYRIAWRNYNIAIATYNLAKENMGYARENLDVQLARFKVGVGTTLESREAENAFVQAIILLFTAEYDLKVSETQVLELDSRLVTE